MTTWSVFKVEITLGNDALTDGDGLANVLRRLAAQVEGQPRSKLAQRGRENPLWLSDANGNAVGSAYLVTRRER
jgi:hypothetical protein